MTKLREIGRRVAELRNREGLIHQALAAEVGLARGTVAGIETGGDRGGIMSMVAIADFFKVPMDWLLCRQVPAGGPLVGELVTNGEELAWLSLWRHLSPEERVLAKRLLHVPEVAV